MQRLLLSLATLAAGGLSPGGGVWAASYPPGAPTLTLAPATVAPSGAVTGTFTGCSLGEAVSFTLAGAIVSDTCGGTGGGAARGLAAPSGGTATAVLTAPMTAGTYIATATGATSGLTASATLTVVAASEVRSAGGLPSTGVDSDRTFWIATAALVVGFGLVTVAWRRRPAHSPPAPVPAHGGLFRQGGRWHNEHRGGGRGRLATPELLATIPSDPPADLPYRGWRRHVKRATDLGLVVLTLPLTVPVIVILSVGVKLTSRGPAFFRQERVGQHGETFSMLKFRTMYIDAAERLEADPQLRDEFLRNDFKLPIEKDPRIVPFGRFLRQASLDELPQLFNVLSSKMSLVGPRPVFEGQIESYGPLAWAYLEAKPGLTGEWQTSGRNFVHFPERALLDADYLQRWTLHSDIAILLKTIPVVMRRDGAE